MYFCSVDKAITIKTITIMTFLASTFVDLSGKKVIVLGYFSSEYGMPYSTIYLEGFAPSTPFGEIWDEMSLSNFLQKEDGRFVKRDKHNVLFQQLELSL